MRPDITETADIREFAAGLSMDESDRVICPRCGGGKTRERSLLLVKWSDGIFYKCYRGTCSMNDGVVYDSGVSQHSDQKKREFIPKPFHEELVSVIPKPIFSHYLKKYDLNWGDMKMQRIRWAPESKRIHFPLTNELGYEFGYALRACNSNYSKWEMFKTTDVPMLHFPESARGGAGLVLVEDIISAIVVSKVHPAAALLGTIASTAVVGMLLASGHKHIIMMLDGDDAGQAGADKFRRKYAGSFLRYDLILLPPGKDPKDYSEDSLSDMLTGFHC